MTAAGTDIDGTWVRLEALRESHLDELAELDWGRAASPNMGGLVRRGGSEAATMVFRSRRTGEALGVLDAVPLTGYPGVCNVSVFTDEAVAGAGLAIDAYGIYVTALFASGVRLIHHEVFEFNRPIRRILSAAGVESSARLREHGYAAGRWWDVLVYSYDEPHWRGVQARFGGGRIGRPIG